MTPKQLQHIKLTSMNAVQSLYTQDYSSVFPVLHPDVSLISSADNQYCRGKPAVTEFLSSMAACMPPSNVWGAAVQSAMPASLPAVSLSCQVLYSDLESCTVLCSCSSKKRLEYCATFLWRIYREGPRIYHIHASKSPANPEPVLTFTGRRAESFYLRPDDILYVEADNVFTNLICGFRTLQVRQPISSVKNALPDYFLQIHRSFLVNIHYTAGLQRYTLELTNGAQLPIPEKKYKWLKEYLERFR